MLLGVLASGPHPDRGPARAGQDAAGPHVRHGARPGVHPGPVHPGHAARRPDRRHRARPGARVRSVFRPGPVFTGLLLADEINRTPPKTQAALLEAMAEGQVSVDGVTRPLPQPFVVLATDNPIEYEGTYPLPEAQLDRFTARVRLGYLDAEGEAEMVRRGWPAARPRRARAGHRRRPAAGHAGVAGERAAAPGPARLRGRAGRRHPDPPAGHRGRLAARHAGGDPAGPRPRRAGRPGVRDAGGHQGGRGARAGPPPGPAAGDVGPAGDRRGRHRRGPGHRARPARAPRDRLASLAPGRGTWPPRRCSRCSPRS